MQLIHFYTRKRKCLFLKQEDNETFSSRESYDRTYERIGEASNYLLNLFKLIKMKEIKMNARTSVTLHCPSPRRNRKARTRDSKQLLYGKPLHTFKPLALLIARRGLNTLNTLRIFTTENSLWLLGKKSMKSLSQCQRENSSKRNGGPTIHNGWRCFFIIDIFFSCE